MVYNIQIGPGNTPMFQLPSVPFSRMNMTITSSYFHHSANILYIGYSGLGTASGKLVAINMTIMQVQHIVTFDRFLSNPRAITYDEKTDSIYVGFNGNDIVIKLNNILVIQAYQRLPPTINKIEAARVGVDHVYFITNEQHSKVLRVNKTDFCSTLCPYNGYCSAGKCRCYESYTLNKEGTICDLNIRTNTNTITDKGAAVALGVLFALTLIIGTLGWILFWRAKKGYQSIQ